MNILDWNSLDPARQAAALERPKLLRDAKLMTEVERIVRRVRKDGDAALMEGTEVRILATLGLSDPY